MESLLNRLLEFEYRRLESKSSPREDFYAAQIEEYEEKLNSVLSEEHRKILTHYKVTLCNDESDQQMRKYMVMCYMSMQLGLELGRCLETENLCELELD